MSRTHLRRPAAFHGWQEADRRRAMADEIRAHRAKLVANWVVLSTSAAGLVYMLSYWLGGAA